jgi:hypothetical protein
MPLKQISGQSGELRVGYQCAAKLGKWSIKDYVLGAEVVEADSYWLGKQPIVAHLWVGAHRWLFDVDSFSNSGKRIQAQLSPQTK